MKSLHITNAWHPQSGGVRTFYSALLEAGNRLGRHVVVVAPGVESRDEPVGPFGRLRLVAAPSAPAFDRRYRLIYPHQYLPGLGGRLLQILRDEQPDIVEIADKYSLPYLAGLLRRGYLRGLLHRPTLIGLSNERFDDNLAAYVHDGPWVRRFTRWYLRHIYGPPFDAHLANSEYTARELRAAMPERHPGFIRVCPMGVDTTTFSPTRLSPELRERLLQRCGGSPGTRLLLYAGRLAPEKNLDLLLAALPRVNNGAWCDIRLVIAGDGPWAERLVREANGALAGRLLMLGSLDRATLAACYASCDVFVHPNPREPFGIGPLEAMASGIPVVLPGSGGVLTYATPLNAWLAEPTPDRFAEAIRSALHGNPARVRQALATSRTFDWSAVTARHFAVHDAVHREVSLRLGLPRDRATPAPVVGQA